MDNYKKKNNFKENPCVWGMVRTCRYQDTSNIKIQSDLNLQVNLTTVNHSICDTCISVRKEQKLFNINETLLQVLDALEGIQGKESGHARHAEQMQLGL